MGSGTPGTSSSVQVSNRAGRTAYLAMAILGVLFSLGMLASGEREALFLALLVGLPSLFLVSRVPRIGLVATSREVIVRNVGRTYRVERDDLVTIRVGDGGHTTGLTSALIVERRKGKPIKATGTASYSRAKVERMLSRVQD